ncbi:hypothetical protein HOG98_05745 [bacterium]|jgi:hypothetical protein|nr:hypothetical protein [bacterium]
MRLFKGYGFEDSDNLLKSYEQFLRTFEIGKDAVDQGADDVSFEISVKQVGLCLIKKTNPYQGVDSNSMGYKETNLVLTNSNFIVPSNNLLVTH